MKKAAVFGGENNTEQKSNIRGKVFYLDVTKDVPIDKVTYYVKLLGGRITLFWSKDVSYLVTNKECREVHAYEKAATLGVETLTHRELYRMIKDEYRAGLHRTTKDPLTNIVNKRQSFGGKTSAKETKERKKYIFKHPFILIEDATEKHAPFHKEYHGKDKKCLPVLWNSRRSTTPKTIERKEQKIKEKQCFPVKDGNAIQSVSLNASFTQHVPHAAKKENMRRTSNRLQAIAPTLPPLVSVPLKNKRNNTYSVREEVKKKKEKAGYCEYCCERYECILKHIRLALHRRYATDKRNYTSLDMFLETTKRKEKSEQSTRNVIEVTTAPIRDITHTITKKPRAFETKKENVLNMHSFGSETTSPILKRKRSTIR